MKRQHLQRIRESLPQPDILGREEYFSTAILVPLVDLGGEEQLLFEKRAAGIRQGGEVCFPGGHFSPADDTSYQDTAVRETVEELGLDRAQIEVAGQLDTLVSPRGLIVECYLGHLDITSLDDLVLQQSEVDEVFAVPVRWFLDNPPDIYHTRVEIQPSYADSEGNEEVLLPVDELGLPSRYGKNRSEWKHRVVVYRYGERIIWGLTAAVVENLMKKVFIKLR